jgi:hypothetical protein
MIEQNNADDNKKIYEILSVFTDLLKSNNEMLQKLVNADIGMQKALIESTKQMKEINKKSEDFYLFREQELLKRDDAFAKKQHKSKKTNFYIGVILSIISLTGAYFTQSWYAEIKRNIISERDWFYALTNELLNGLRASIYEIEKQRITNDKKALDSLEQKYKIKYNLQFVTKKERMEEVYPNLNFKIWFSNDTIPINK